MICKAERLVGMTGCLVKPAISLLCPDQMQHYLTGTMQHQQNGVLNAICARNLCKEGFPGLPYF